MSSAQRTKLTGPAVGQGDTMSQNEKQAGSELSAGLGATKKMDFRIEFEDGYLIRTIPPASACDRLAIYICKDGISQGMVLLDANKAAEFIGGLKQAFLEFTN